VPSPPWDGNGAPTVGYEVEKKHWEDSEMPPKTGCGPDTNAHVRGAVGCTDDQASGGTTHEDGSVSPDGLKRPITPSWDPIPELNTTVGAFAAPHAEYFEKEDKCVPDEAEESWNVLDQELEAELQRYTDARVYEAEHLCTGLVNSVEFQYKELRAKSGTRRRTMTRTNALPFVQEEREASGGPHRRLLSSSPETSDHSDVLQKVLREAAATEGDSSRFEHDVRLVELAEGSGGGSGGSAPGFKRAEMVVDDDMDLSRSPMDGEPLPPRISPDIPAYDAPEMDLSHVEADAKQIDNCLMKVKELIPMLKILRAELASKATPQLSPETEKALKLGTPPLGPPIES